MHHRNPKARPGNQNASKPAAERRVAMAARVLPETVAILASLAAKHGSVGKAVDHAAKMAAMSRV